MIAQSRNAFEERGERFRLVAQTIPSGSAGRFRLANTSQNHLCLVVMMTRAKKIVMILTKTARVGRRLERGGQYEEGLCD